MLSKMQVFEGNTYFLKIFDVIYIFLILSIMHVMWRSCTVSADHIVLVKNCEVHVLISLKACF